MPAGTQDVGHIEVSSDLRSVLREKAYLVQRLPELTRVSVDAKGAGAGQLVLSVAAAENADAEHPRPACSEQVPDGVADHVTLLGGDGELRGAGKEEVRLGLCPLDITALDYDRFRTEAERLERGVDLWPAPRGCDPEWHSRRPQLGQEFDRVGERPSLRKQLAKEFSVAGLDCLDLGRRERPGQLARHRSCEEATTHANAAMDPPAVDRQACLGQRALPGENVGVDRVDQRSVQVEDQRWHRLEPTRARDRA